MSTITGLGDVKGQVSRKKESGAHRSRLNSTLLQHSGEHVFMTDERKANDKLWEKYAYCVPPSEEETALQERRLKPASAFSLPLISLRLGL